MLLALRTWLWVMVGTYDLVKKEWVWVQNCNTGHIRDTYCLCSQCVQHVPTGYFCPCLQCLPTLTQFFITDFLISGLPGFQIHTLPNLHQCQWLLYCHQARCTIAWFYLVHGGIWLQPARGNEFMSVPIPMLDMIGGEAQEEVGWMGDIGMVQRHGKRLRWEKLSR